MRPAFDPPSVELRSSLPKPASGIGTRRRLAPAATCFLCWCKGSMQRNHLFGEFETAHGMRASLPVSETPEGVSEAPYGAAGVVKMKGKDGTKQSSRRASSQPCGHGPQMPSALLQTFFFPPAVAACSDFGNALGRFQKGHDTHIPRALLRSQKVLSFGYFSLHQQRKVTRRQAKDSFFSFQAADQDQVRFALAGEVLSFAGPKESTQRKRPSS